MFGFRGLVESMSPWLELFWDLHNIKPGGFNAMANGCIQNFHCNQQINRVDFSVEQNKVTNKARSNV